MYRGDFILSAKFPKTYSKCYHVTDKKLLIKLVDERYSYLPEGRYTPSNLPIPCLPKSTARVNLVQRYYCGQLLGFSLCLLLRAHFDNSPSLRTGVSCCALVFVRRRNGLRRVLKIVPVFRPQFLRYNQFCCPYIHAFLQPWVDQLASGPSIALEVQHPEGDTYTKFRNLIGPIDPVSFL